MDMDDNEDLELETQNESPAFEPEPVDLDSHSDVLSDAAKAVLFGAPAVANKPDISRLPDAFLNGRPTFTEGDKIVIERHVSFLDGHPYLDTKTYKVRSINTDTGNLWLWDEQLQQSASDNFKVGLANGCRVYKVAMGYNVSTKKKRGRPRKNPIEAAPETPVAPAAPKKRGRPPGSKNRSREELRAEKEAKRAEKMAKKAARNARRPAKAVAA